MVPQELLDQLKGFAEVGRSEASIRQLLLDLGWSEAQISEAITELGGVELFLKSKEVAEATGPRVIEIPSAKKQKRRFRLLLGLGMLVLILGFSGYRYLNSRSPEGLFQTAIGNLGDFRYDVRGELAQRGLSEDNVLETDPDFTLAFDLGGNFRQRVADWPRAVFGINFSVSGKETPQISGSAEVRSLDSELYLKLTRGGSGAGFFESDPLKGKWIRIEASEIFSTGDFLTREKTTEENSSAALGRELTDSEKKALATAFGQSGFFKVKEELNPEVLNGEETRHFILTLREDKVKKFVRAWGDIFETALTPKGATTSLIGDFKLDGFEVTGSGEAWIGKVNRIPLRLKSQISLSFEDREWRVTWDGLYSEFGEAVNLEALVPDETFETLVVSSKGFLDRSRAYSLQLVPGVLADYREKCGFYPGAANCKGGFLEPPSDFGELMEVLEVTGLDVTEVRGVLGEKERYHYGSNGEYYVLGVTLDDLKHLNISGGVGGSALGVNCGGKVYCLLSPAR